MILRKILKNVATICHILRLKCTKLDFGWGFRTRPYWWSSQRSPDPLAGLKGPTSKGRGGNGEEKGGEGKGREKGEEEEGEKREGEGKGKGEE